MEPLIDSLKGERIDVRLRKDVKQLIFRAAEVAHQSVSDFRSKNNPKRSVKSTSFDA